jgi:predicted RNA-binding protein (virulence factor B family)
MFARLASETIVEKMFTPVSNDDMRNQVLKARPYRLLRIFIMPDNTYFYSFA